MIISQTDTEILAIYESSVDFRRFIESVDSNKWGQDGAFRKFSYFPKNCCVITCHLLARYLIRYCEVRGAVSIVHGAHPSDGWHFWIGVDDLIIDITADQFDEFYGRQVVVGATGWHDKCRILNKYTATYEFTDVDEGCDYADQIQLEYAYKQLVCEK